MCPRSRGRCLRGGCRQVCMSTCQASARRRHHLGVDQVSWCRVHPCSWLGRCVCRQPSWCGMHRRRLNRSKCRSGSQVSSLDPYPFHLTRNSSVPSSSTVESTMESISHFSFGLLSVLAVELLSVLSTLAVDRGEPVGVEAAAMAWPSAAGLRDGLDAARACSSDASPTPSCPSPGMGRQERCSDFECSRGDTLGSAVFVYSDVIQIFEVVP